MLAYLDAVDKDFGLPIHGAEMQQETLGAESGRGECTAIPEALRGRDGALHAGKRRFDGKWNQDAAFECVRPGGVFGGDGIAPEAVEIGPCSASQLGPRVIGQGVGGIHLRSPRRGDGEIGQFPLRAAERNGTAEQNCEDAARVHGPIVHAGRRTWGDASSTMMLSAK